MRIGVSIPDDVFREGEQLARRLGKSRSARYTAALAAFLDAHRRGDVTARLNRVYERESSSVDPVLAALQATSIEEEDW